MDEVGFTAGVTRHDNRTLSVDVVAIDGSGITYKSDEGVSVLPWAEIKAVMLATPDHMLESGGYLFSMAELVQEREGAQPYSALDMRRFGLELLREAAPRICPLADGCGLLAGRDDDAARGS